MNCKPYCHITTGFSGAGAFSDGKLSLSYEVGGDLPSLIGEQKAQETINYADQIYLEFGADKHVEGLGNTEEVKQIRMRAIRAGLKLVDCPIADIFLAKPRPLHDLLQKAAGWLLREAGKRDEERLKQWLTWRSKDIPRTMLRYAIEKFTKEERDLFLSLPTK